MAGYLGATPVPQATQHRESFTATAAQTTFATAGYTVGFVDVYLNGVHLTPADVTATNGSDVVLGACLVNDIVDVISHSAFELNAQTFTGDFTVDGTTLVVDSTNNRVGIGTSSSDEKLTVNGDIKILSTNKLHFTNTSDQTSVHAPSSNTLAFTTNSTERMRIDATGAVTMPAQPAFLVQPASQQDNIAIDSDVTVVFGTERFDQNADFASNTFTAPVTGKYQLGASLYFLNLDIDVDYYECYIVTSNRTYHVSVIQPDFTSDVAYITFGNNVLADMDASDTAFVRIRQSGGGAQTDIRVTSYFCGYLVA